MRGMLRPTFRIGLPAIAVLLFAGRATAQEMPADLDHVIVFEFGAEGDWVESGGAPHRRHIRVRGDAGVGPELIHSTAEHRTFWGLSAVGDLMVWPKENVGWYLEPGLERTFEPSAHRTGMAMAVGIIVGR